MIRAREGVWVGLLLLAGCESRSDLLGDGAPTDARAERGANQQNGARCVVDQSCLTGHCRDGFCCETDCTGPCSRCDEPGREGLCTQVPAGQSPPPGKSCPSQPPEQCGLDGTCDGQGRCRDRLAGTVCKPAACELAPQATRLKLAWLCDGQGSCEPFAPDELDCAPYGCDPASQRCFALCTGSASCKKGVACDRAGRCGGSLLPLGVPCTAPGLCESGSCVEGVCCSGACLGACETCSLAGAAGKCVPVPLGTAPPPGKLCPIDPGNPCGNDGTCDGKKKCRVALPTQACGPTTCSLSTLTFHYCNSDPAGPACVKKEVSCGSYRCQPGGSSCYGSCLGESQCAAGAACVAGRCLE